MTASDPKGSAKFSVKQWDGVRPEQGLLHWVPRWNDARRGQLRIARFSNSLIVRFVSFSTGTLGVRPRAVSRHDRARARIMAGTTDVYRCPPITIPRPPRVGSIVSGSQELLGDEDAG